MELTASGLQQTMMGQQGSARPYVSSTLFPITISRKKFSFLYQLHFVFSSSSSVTKHKHQQLESSGGHAHKLYTDTSPLHAVHHNIPQSVWPHDASISIYPGSTIGHAFVAAMTLRNVKIGDDPSRCGWEYICLSFSRMDSRIPEAWEAYRS